MAVIIETLMAEDLEYGINATTKTHPSGGTLNGTQISLSSFSTCGPAGEAFSDDWDPGTIASGSQVSETFDIPGAAPGDKVLWALVSLGTTALIMSGHVSAANEVMVTLANLTGVSQTIGSGRISILVFKHRTDPGQR